MSISQRRRFTMNSFLATTCSFIWPNASGHIVPYFELHSWLKVGHFTRKYCFGISNFTNHRKIASECFFGDLIDAPGSFFLSVFIWEPCLLKRQSSFWLKMWDTNAETQPLRYGDQFKADTFLFTRRPTCWAGCRFVLCIVNWSKPIK